MNKEILQIVYLNLRGWCCPAQDGALSSFESWAALRENAGVLVVDRPTQLVCIWIFICWVGGGNPCGVADFCIGDSCRNKKHTGFVFFLQNILSMYILSMTQQKTGQKTDKNPKKNCFFQYYLIRSWAKSSWTRFGRAKSSWTRFGFGNDTSRWR